MSWPLVKLSDLIEVMHQGINTAADNVIYADYGVPIIQSKHLKDRTVEFGDTKFLSEGDVQKYQSKYFARKDDILFANIGTIGKSVIVASDNEFMFAWNVFVIRVKREMIDVLYLKLFLDRLSSINYYDRFLTGGTVKFVNKKVMGEIEIPLPPLEEQKRIAAILDKADAIRRKRQQAIKLADDFLRSVFLEMFGDPVTNPKGWEVDLLKNQILSANNGLSRRSAAEENFGDIVLRLQDVHYDGIRYDKKLSRIQLDESEKRRYLLHEGDLLFIRVNGNPDYVGRSAVFSGYDEHVYHNDHLIRLKVGKNYNSEFLSFAFNSKGGRKLISKYIKTSAGQHTISQDGIERIEFYIPSIHLQNKFVSIKNKLLSIPYDVEFSENLFASLSQKAFSKMI